MGADASAENHPDRWLDDLVLVDGVAVGTVNYNHNRPDIAGLFPGLNNTNGAIGFRVLDTTTLTNGTHTIAWTVADNQGAVEGIGSRFFTVWNGAGSRRSAMGCIGERHCRCALESALGFPPASERRCRVASLDNSAIVGRRGWDLNAPLHVFEQGASGRDDHPQRRGQPRRVAVRAGVARGLPPHKRRSRSIANRLEAGRRNRCIRLGTGRGLCGGLRSGFRAMGRSRAAARHEVRIILAPKGRGHVGVQVAIDLPRERQAVNQPFVIAGWAADWMQPWARASIHCMCGRIRSWVDRRCSSVRRAYGRIRLDVVAVYGESIPRSGFGLTVQGLGPGPVRPRSVPLDNVLSDFGAAKGCANLSAVVAMGDM